MKNKDTMKYMAMIVIAMLIAGTGTFFALGGGSASTVDAPNTIVDDDGNAVAPWANKLVPLNLLTSDKFTGADVDAQAKVYDVKPADWNNARGTFEEAVDYTVYTATDGVLSINKEMPGEYYAVLSADGYNLDFVTITVPNGVNMGDITDYKSAPDSVLAEMTLVGATSDSDMEITLTDASSKTIKQTLTLAVNENTEFRGWKVIVNDEEGFSTDTDGDGTYDEGITKLTVSVAGIEKTIFNPNSGIDEFDSNDQFTFLLNNIVLADEADLDIKVVIEGATSSTVAGADDEVWGNGEGVLSTIKIYDETGSVFASVDVKSAEADI